MWLQLDLVLGKKKKKVDHQFKTTLHPYISSALYFRIIACHTCVLLTFKEHLKNKKKPRVNERDNFKSSPSMGEFILIVTEPPSLEIMMGGASLGCWQPSYVAKVKAHAREETGDIFYCEGVTFIFIYIFILVCVCVCDSCSSLTFLLFCFSLQNNTQRSLEHSINGNKLRVFISPRNGGEGGTCMGVDGVKGILQQKYRVVAEDNDLHVWDVQSAKW